jgi:uncharacterized membrane protein YkvA (DUF1232 family)/thiol-disulfide isomerase/thioredoxin
MGGRLVDVNDGTYDETARTRGLVLITFSAPWAAPGRLLGPILTALAADYDGQLLVGIINTDLNPTIAEQIGVRSIPTTILYKDGELIAHWIGAVSREAFEGELDKYVPRPAKRTPAPIDKLEDAKGRLIQLMLNRQGLESCIQSSSIAVATGQVGRLAEQVEAANGAVQALIGLVMLLEGAVNDEKRPTYQRLGALSALYYLVAPQDALDDNLPGGYGYLDDFLVLSSGMYYYVQKTDPARVQQVANLMTLIWLSLPPAVVGPLMQYITRMEFEAQHLASLSEEQLRPLFAQLRSQPAPMQFVIPAVQQQAIAQAQTNGLGGWSQNAAGAIWGSGDGRSTYMRFEGGGSIGMVGDKIVGLG